MTIIQLNPRQLKIIDIVKENEPITSESIASILNVTRATLRSDLAILTMTGILDARPKVGYFYSGINGASLVGNKIKDKKVKDIMSMPVVIKQDTNIYDSIVTMFLSDVGSIFIIDDDENLCGVVSRKDLLKATIGGFDINKMPIGMVMTRTPNVVTVKRDDSIILAARKIIEHEVDSIPVVEINEENGQPVSVSGELTVGEHTINVSLASGQVTYTTSDGENYGTERQAIDHEVQIARAANPDGPSETQLYETWGVDLQVEALGKVSIKDIQTVLSGNTIQEAMQGKVDEEGRLTEPITLQVGSENIEFEAGSTEQDIRQKLVEAMGLEDTTLIDAITTAIQTAAPSIGQAISTAISDVFSGTNTETGDSSLTISPTSIEVDASNADISLTGANISGSTITLPEGEGLTVNAIANTVNIV